MFNNLKKIKIMLKNFFTIVYFRNKQYQMISSLCFAKREDAKKHAEKFIKSLPSQYEWSYEIETQIGII